MRLLNGGVLAVIAMAGLSGCGGDGGHVPRRQTVPLTGGVDSLTASNTADIPASNQSQTINVTINGQPSTAQLPPTTTPVPANSTLVVVPAGTRVFTGLRRSPNRAPGDVFVNGVDTGVNLTPSGELDGNIAVQNNASYEVFVQGPMFIESEGRRLDISEGIEFNVVVRQFEVSLPSTIDGTIPSNGGTAEDMFLAVEYPDPFVDDHVQLTVVKSNGNVTQGRRLSENFTTFRDFVPNVVVPAEGIQRVIYRFSEQ